MFKIFKYNNNASPDYHSFKKWNIATKKERKEIVFPHQS